MNETLIPVAAIGPSKQRKREAPRGRTVDPAALAEVQALVGNKPLRHDWLIEYLHLINDHYKQLSAPHLAALARLMGLAQTEVYEVATFYHHFDVVKENRDGTVPAPAALTVRVCDGLSCEMAGARQLLDRLPDILGREVRVIAAPCVGRCEQAPVAVVHQKPLAHATLESVKHAVAAGETRDETKADDRLRHLPRTGRLCAVGRVHRTQTRYRVRHQDAGRLGSSRARRCRLSGGPQVAHRQGRACAAPDGGEHR